jgi:hypothetical protein
VAYLAAVQHDLRRAFDAIDRATALCADNDLTNYLYYVEGQRAYALLLGGSWDQAAAHARTVLARPRLPFVTRLRPLTVLGLVHARRGEAADGWLLLDEALGAD